MIDQWIHIARLYHKRSVPFQINLWTYLLGFPLLLVAMKMAWLPGDSFILLSLIAGLPAFFLLSCRPLFLPYFMLVKRTPVYHRNFILFPILAMGLIPGLLMIVTTILTLQTEQPEIADLLLPVYLFHFGISFPLSLLVLPQSSLSKTDQLKPAHQQSKKVMNGNLKNTWGILAVIYAVAIILGLVESLSPTWVFPCALVMGVLGAIGMVANLAFFNGIWYGKGS